jgi:hypothetical protein
VKPLLFYVGPISLPPRCECGAVIVDGHDWCSDRCAEDHDTAQKGGAPLPEHERCMCPALIGSATHGFGRHAWDCPCFVPHPEDFTHPTENT